MKGYWGVEVQLHPFFDLRIRRRWVVSFTPQPLYPRGKSPWYPLDRRLVGLQCQSGRGGEKKIPISVGAVIQRREKVQWYHETLGSETKQQNPCDRYTICWNRRCNSSLMQDNKAKRTVTYIKQGIRKQFFWTITLILEDMTVQVNVFQ
jgi:hypothetical protein